MFLAENKPISYPCYVGPVLITGSNSRSKIERTLKFYRAPYTIYHATNFWS